MDHDRSPRALRPARVGRGYDDRVTETDPPAATPPSPPSPSGATAQAPGERRLAHPPSDRYRAADPSPAEVEHRDAGASVARGLALAVVAAGIGGIAIVLLGGILTLTAGLVVVAAATGWAVGAGLRFGAGGRLRQRRRVVVALVIAVGSIAAGQLGLWQYARSEGGVLAPLDYLGEVYGPLVPLQFVAAAVAAWLAAR